MTTWNARWKPVAPEVGMVFRYFYRTKFGRLEQQREVEMICGDKMRVWCRYGGQTDAEWWMLDSFHRLTANGFVEVISSSRLNERRRGRR